jgi:hypothetical protein
MDIKLRQVNVVKREKWACHMGTFHYTVEYIVWDVLFGSFRCKTLLVYAAITGPPIVTRCHYSRAIYVVRPSDPEKYNLTYPTHIRTSER